MFRRLLILAVIAASSSRAEDPVAAARQWQMGHREAILDAFQALLAIPNVAADHVGLDQNAKTLAGLLEQRHCATRLLTVPGAPSVVFGERRVTGAVHTIVFYAHYDGQPVTASEWRTPPFRPVLQEVNREQRIYARSASDDKAAIYAQLTALDALDAAHIALRSNIRFIWEGEEEAGSRHLESILASNRDIVQGDMWLICDGPVDQSGQQTILFGARGDAHLEITVYGPDRPLHSGHYGNWSPNPAMMLAQLLAGMKDEKGRVQIPDFYTGVQRLGPTEEQALARAPVHDEQLRQAFGLGHTDGDGVHLLDLLNLPSLEIRGMSSAQTGKQATNVIPATATVDLDLRLVVGTDWQKQQQKVIDYVRSQGYFVVDTPPGKEVLLTHARVAMVTKDEFGYNAVRTPMDVPAAAQVISAVRAARSNVIEWPSMGGSLPLEAIRHVTESPIIIVPIANYDNNQHAANENLRLQNLWDGIETMASLLYLQ